MSYNIKQIGNRVGETNEIIRLTSEFTKINIETDTNQTFAILVAMTGESHRNRIRHRLIIPNVKTHVEAIEKAKEKYKLQGEWCTQIGVTLFQTNTNVDTPFDWEDCEQQFHKG
ncbi:hypothetical protein IFU39_16710 [Paenibacillus sp. CFBP 13594]|uniref:hypothetical protein n=1 Tax=Paenibacillus sp. CFBP 13594 TaxID=2774037 RepID=UPI00177EB27F|nr:hypothetical protein [Paenibacillus sp. CFBP 13594]MBD8839456.1 hypothetical protein [Paenibacillus sp. CFBP 13594]